MARLRWTRRLCLCQPHHSLILWGWARISDAHNGAKRSKARWRKKKNVEFDCQATSKVCSQLNRRRRGNQTSGRLQSSTGPLDRDEYPSRRSKPWKIQSSWIYRSGGDVGCCSQFKIYFSFYLLRSYFCFAYRAAMATLLNTQKPLAALRILWCPGGLSIQANRWRTGKGKAFPHRTNGLSKCKKSTQWKR